MKTIKLVLMFLIGYRRIELVVTDKESKTTKKEIIWVRPSDELWRLTKE